ncbi:hypothetical protein GUJ93_ZPchr0010g8838 [Zizania palustris]|uniref:Uncharacterized protein n=1 Tax=Zizania palustris TaxID=103762 RepID=A0A8J5TGU1_ZIZPA|nr:hypothetical protein GUJ93_ZPchr0010g8838 [Zizania palustris]
MRCARLHVKVHQQFRPVVDLRPWFALGWFSLRREAGSGFLLWRGAVLRVVLGGVKRWSFLSLVYPRRWCFLWRVEATHWTELGSHVAEPRVVKNRAA